MTPRSRSHEVFDTLALARQVANYAQSLGVSDAPGGRRVVQKHLGAALADCVLQAGLNYRTVVRGRVERIVHMFPEAATLTGTMAFVDRGTVSDFLMWTHSEKIERFIRLVSLLDNHSIEDVYELRDWLHGDDCRPRLLKVAGIGPKTVDYLCCLVGVDCIAVDRHIKVFVRDAGVGVEDYEGVKLVVSYAADLLGVSRRDFDSWIWHLVSRKSNTLLQYSFL